MSITEIEALRKVVNNESRSAEERKQAAEHILKLQGEEPEVIDDDDPELAAYMAEPGDELKNLVPGLFKRLTLSEAKTALAARRTFEIMGDESKPMELRIQAGRRYKASLVSWHPDRQYPEAELVERHTVHPHYPRLKELRFMMEDESVSIKTRFGAIDEYKQLRDKFPMRSVPHDAHVLDNFGYNDLPGRKLASEVGKRVAEKYGKSWSYIAEGVRSNRGADYDLPIGEL